jgi:hypothetical protein
MSVIFRNEDPYTLDNDDQERRCTIRYYRIKGLRYCLLHQDRRAEPNHRAAYNNDTDHMDAISDRHQQSVVIVE